MDPPFINIPLSGPLLQLSIPSLSVMYMGVSYLDYYLYCRTSIPYQTYKNYWRFFHIIIPFIFAPKLKAATTFYISYPWFIASVGAYVSELYKHSHTGDKAIGQQTLSYREWVVLVAMHGFAAPESQQANGTAITLQQIKREGMHRIIIDALVLLLALQFLNPLLLDNPAQLLTWKWYSPTCIYHGFLMGFKGYTLIVFNDLLIAIPQALYGIKTLYIFNRPFLATSPKDFWGNRWNMVVRSLLHKQVFTKHSNERDIQSKSLRALRAFLISALMHEVIMSLTNRQVTLEQFAFFMIQGIEIFIQSAFLPEKVTVPRVVSIMLTMVFISLTAKLFLASYLRCQIHAVMFSKHAPI